MPYSNSLLLTVTVSLAGTDRPLRSDTRCDNVTGAPCDGRNLSSLRLLGVGNCNELPYLDPFRKERGTSRGDSSQLLLFPAQHAAPSGRNTSGKQYSLDKVAIGGTSCCLVNATEACFDRQMHGMITKGG
jgi:hypothetical protein